MVAGVSAVISRTLSSGELWTSSQVSLDKYHAVLSGT